jgi:hypothetical protein
MPREFVCLTLKSSPKTIVDEAVNLSRAYKVVHARDLARRRRKGYLR